jgi:NitT/TauT family transport system ATP-binding protein
MQQRVALVRGFALGAPLVLMDEPFAALDEITRAEMRELLARLLQQHPATVLFVTHSITEAVHLSDRVLVFSPRPATIVADIAVPMPRPRPSDPEDDPEFIALCAEVRHRLHQGMGR